MTQVECINETLKHIHRVEELLSQAIEKILKHARLHDASKLTEPELPIFTEFTPRLRETVYNSEEYKKCTKEMKVAVDHHYSINTHHPDHWEHGACQMNLIEIIEMLADWKAATERMKNGNLKTSIEQNQKRFGYSDEIKAFLMNTATYLKWC